MRLLLQQPRRYLWPRSIERAAWKTAVGLPADVEKRRASFLERRTGPQLRRLCERIANKQFISPEEDALLRVWRQLAPSYAVSRRVLSECATRGATPRSILVVGDAGAAAAASDVFRDAAVQAVENTKERAEAATKVVDATLTANLVDVARRNQAFDVVACHRHLTELDASRRDAALALLWGCVAPRGILLVVDTPPLVQFARSRMLHPESKTDASVLAPCTSSGDCPNKNCAFPQMVMPPSLGPPVRSLETARPFTSRPFIEKFAYVALSKGVVAEGAAQQPHHHQGRVVATPLKRDGHVILEVCTHEATTQRLTVTRSALQDDPEFDYSLARKATWGSLLTYEATGIEPKVPNWHNLNAIVRQRRLEETPFE